MMSDRLSDAEFDELKRQRDASLSAALRALFDEKGWDPDKAFVHTSGSSGCYCACASRGPCQHEWNGPWRDFDDGRGGETTCSKCGAGSMSHDMWLY